MATPPNAVRSSAGSLGTTNTPGFAEIAWTKWVGGPRILAMRNTLTVLPKEILAETNIAFAESCEDLAKQMSGMLCLTAES